MNLIENIIKKVQSYQNEIKVNLPEGVNDQMQTLAFDHFKTGNVKPILVFKSQDQVSEKIKQSNIGYYVMEEFDLQALAEFLFTLRNGKITMEQANQLINQPNYFATVLLKQGLVDCMVGGIDYSTKDIVAPALQIIKTKPEYKIVSSVFLMTNDKENYVFTDCAINVSFDQHQLKDIAKLAVKAAKLFNIENPQLALLSYSTKGSGKGESVDKVSKAYQLLQQEQLDCVIEGEIQFDAAWDQMVRSKKAPNSSLQGRANIYVFPDLNSANIGYKIMQRVANFQAIGPVIMGLDKPVNDLSRGASLTDIYNTIMLTAYNCIIEKNNIN